MKTRTVKKNTKPTENAIPLSSLYDDLVAGLTEAAAHFRGEVALRTTTLTVSEVTPPALGKPEADAAPEVR